MTTRRQTSSTAPLSAEADACGLALSSGFVLLASSGHLPILARVEMMATVSTSGRPGAERNEAKGSSRVGFFVRDARVLRCHRSYTSLAARRVETPDDDLAPSKTTTGLPS